jgi:6-pyruvoyltetrahydropterin/6-carboxytetrahydropterin synthase
VYTLRVKASFDAAHRIEGHQGPCKNLHGHRYQVEVEVAATDLDKLGMVMDFGVVKAKLEEVLPDHVYLNELVDFPTSAENLSKWLFERLERTGLPIVALTLWETENCGCRYSPDR